MFTGIHQKKKKERNVGIEIIKHKKSGAMHRFLERQTTNDLPYFVLNAFNQPLKQY